MIDHSRKVIPFSKIFNASLLIAGTCIGGGMLALPISTGPVGFIPSLIVMIICCVFMTITGLLYLEATLWMKDNAHMNTLSQNLLNSFWKGVCWVTYLFICYASLVAYTSGGGKEIAFVMSEFFNFPQNNYFGIIIFLAFFITILLLNKILIERINSIMFISMIFAYCMLIISSNKNLDLQLILRKEWNTHLFFIFPLMLATFSFPGIVPTIVPYLEKNSQAVKKSIILGTSITFIVYFLWLIVIYGSVPYEGKYSLKEALLCNIPATECLHHAFKNPYLSSIAQFFAFFALSTSFLGISLSLLDFLEDSFKNEIKPVYKKIISSFLIFVPSFLFALWFEGAFLTALELTGGIGDAIVSGIIPALMVWNGRYNLAMKSDYKVWGGKKLLIGIVLISCGIFFCELFRRIF